MPLPPFLASSRQPPVAASCSCCQPCSHGRHAGNIDCKTSRCSSTVRRGHSCERGSNEIPLQLLSIQLCQIYESIFLMLFSCHLWDFTDMPKQEQMDKVQWSREMTSCRWWWWRCSRRGGRGGQDMTQSCPVSLLQRHLCQANGQRVFACSGEDTSLRMVPKHWLHLIASLSWCSDIRTPQTDPRLDS